MTLDAAPHPLTLDQIEEGHALIIGQTRSGKTYLARAAIEQLYRAGRRIGAIDKLGNHWGLTLDRDGQGPGLDFVIFGGKRAMVPMTPDQGTKLGRLFVERNIPAIFDVSQWHADDQQRWVADFCDAVFRYNEGALHLALDEAQSWVPLNGGGPAFQAVLRLAEQGLGNGIHLLMTVQRLSRLDATVRSMARIVVVMRQTGTIDRTAVTELVSSSSEQAAILKRDLSGLPVGTGYIWDPGSDTLARVVFPPNETFDSSRTPKHGDTPPPAIAASSALVDELRAVLAPPAEPVSPGNSVVSDDTISTDPVEAYRKGGVVGTMLKERDDRIAELENETMKLRRLGDVLWRRGIVIGLSRAKDAIAPLILAANETDERPPVDSETLASFLAITKTADDEEVVRGAPETDEEMDAFIAAARSPQGATIRVTSAPKGGRDVEVRDRDLRVLAILVAVHPAGLTEAAWATRAGLARKGGSWQARKRGFEVDGLIERLDGRWFATHRGVDRTGDTMPALPAPGRALVDWWAARLGAPGRLLKILADVHPRGLTRDALAAEANMAKGGGAFSSHVGMLKSAELVVEHGKRLSVAPALTSDA